MSYTIEGKDAIQAKDCVLTFTLDDKTYICGYMEEFNAKIKINKTTIKPIGAATEKNVASTISGTYSGKGYYCSSLLKKQVIRYMNGERDIPTLTVTGSATNTGLGKERITIKNCMPDEYDLINFNSGDGAQMFNLSGTFDGAKMSAELNNSAVPEV